MAKRLPRKVRLGGDYYVRVRIVRLAIIRDLIEDDADGCWIESLAEVETGGPAGTIYIDASLSAAEKWNTYWHELQHAILDVTAWDPKRWKKK